MLIVTLVEDTPSGGQLSSEHGLSMYIETEKHRLLFDMGQTSIFAENAARMNIDLSEVDIAVISHGHYDHGGGLKTFMNINKSAKIFVSRNAFGDHYSEGAEGTKRYIGLDKNLERNERIIFAGDNLVIDGELEIFSGVKGERYIPAGNRYLFRKAGEAFLQDDFAHEQNLIISEGEMSCSCQAARTKA